MSRQWLRRPSPALVVSVIALVAALGGGAYATIRGIPDAKGLFHGCVNNRTGVLRVVGSANSCRHRRVIRRAGKRIVLPGELAIAWNQTGPQGAAGLQGRAGTNGTNGQNGKDGQSVTSSSLSTGDANCPNGGSSFQSTSGTTFACNGATGPTGPSDAFTASNGNEVSLSAGSYVVFAAVTFHTSTATAGTLDCHVDDATASATLDSGSEQIPATSGWNAHLTFAVPLSLSAAHTVGLGCAASGPGGSFTTFSVTAVKVGTLHTT